MAINLRWHDDWKSDTFWEDNFWGSAPSNYYTLPDAFIFMENDVDARFESANRALADGGAIYGKEYGIRDITIKATIFGTTTATHRTLYRAIRAAVSKAQYLDWEAGWYIGIQAPRIRHKWQPGTDRTWSEFEITWKAANPFFYEGWSFGVGSVQRQTQSVSGNQTINLNDSALEEFYFPKIQVYVSGAMASGFSMTNTSWGSPFFSINRALAVGEFVTIDTMFGKVTSDPGGAGNNEIANFSGEFFGIGPGNNTIAYVGGAADLVIFTKRRIL